MYFFKNKHIAYCFLGFNDSKNSRKNTPILLLPNGYLFDNFPSFSQILNKTIK